MQAEAPAVPFEGSHDDWVAVCDFDGTIAVADTLCVLVDHNIGKPERERLDKAIADRTMSFRESCTAMFKGLKVSVDEATRMIASEAPDAIDPGFARFQAWCAARRIPIYIVSSGFETIIKGIMSCVKLEPPGIAGVRANDYHIDAGTGEWVIDWRDETSHGHDKCRSIEAILRHEGRSKLVYVGDGVSDLPVAEHTVACILAKRGLRLEQFCADNGRPHQPYTDFTDIVDALDARDGAATSTSTTDEGAVGLEKGSAGGAAAAPGAGGAGGAGDTGGAGGPGHAADGDAVA